MAAELAEGKGDHAGIGDAPVLVGEVALHQGIEAAEHGLGDIAQHPGRARRLDDPAQDLDAHLEAPVVGPAAAQVEHLLGPRRPIEQAVELVLEGAEGRRRVHEARRQHAVQHLRVAAEVGGETGCFTHDLGDQSEQAGVDLEYGEQLNAGR